MFWKSKKLYLFAVALLGALSVMAGGPKPPSALDNGVVLLIVSVILLLAIVIMVLGSVLLTAARDTAEKEKAAVPGDGAGAEKTIGIRDVPVQAGLGLTLIPGISDTAFYLMMGVMVIELVAIFYLLFNLNVLLRKRLLKEDKEVSKSKRLNFGLIWDRINSFRPAAEEEMVDTGHVYDGIRELDNKLPPWWLYGFYCTILFAGVYLWRYHISHTAPLPAEEYAIAVKQAEIRKQEYLKKAANNVDENTVKLLTAPADVEAGKAIFATTCFACHGKAGEGGVGPNLTDDFWLHGGSVQDIFKTIKYGWPDKGMKSWKDDFSPSQIAQLTSYIKSIHGTNPPNGKAPQGVPVK